MGSYWVSYRRNPSEFGLSVINGTSRLNHTDQSAENIFLDMTPSTQGLVNRSVNPGADFDDAFLMLGKTFRTIRQILILPRLEKVEFLPWNSLKPL